MIDSNNITNHMSLSVTNKRTGACAVMPSNPLDDMCKFVTNESVTTQKSKTMESFIFKIKGRGVLVRTRAGFRINGLWKTF